MIVDGMIYNLRSAEDELMVVKKLDSLANLKAGWSYAEGEPISTEVIDKAKQIAQKAIDDGFLETDVFPGLRGNVMVAIYGEEKTLELTVESSGFIDSYLEVDKGNDEEAAHLKIDEAFNKINQLKQDQCNWLGSSIQFITTSRGDDLRALPSSGHPWAAYLSSMKNALFVQAEASAPILVFSTQAFPNPLRSIGSLTDKNFRVPFA